MQTICKKSIICSIIFNFVYIGPTAPQIRINRIIEVGIIVANNDDLSFINISLNSKRNPSQTTKNIKRNSIIRTR
jgi:hypothetical protein